MTDLELAMAQGGQLVPNQGPAMPQIQAPPGSELAQAMAQGGQVMGGAYMSPSPSIAPGAMNPEPGRLESLGRGALQGVTLGFSDEIAGAIGSLFSDKTYSQVRDESRQANEEARKAHGGYYFGGEVAGGLATSLVPGLNVAKGASIAAAAGKSALIGAGAGLGSSESDLTKGEFGKAALDTAKAAAFGAVVGAGAQKLSKVIGHAPEKADKDILGLVVRGEGKAASATRTVQKLVAEDETNVLRAAKETFIPEGATKPITLADIVGKPTAEVFPFIEQRLESVGSQLDPLYTKINQATGGGVSLASVVEHLDQQVKDLAKKPLQEGKIKAIEGIKDSLLNAWAPDMAPALEGAKRLEMMGLTARKTIPDVMVPFQDLREVVTEIGKKSSQVINPLNPGESTIIKREMSSMMFDLLNTQLDAAAERIPALDGTIKAIREINRTYRGLKTIESALEQRATNEAVQTMSGTSKLHGLLGHGGMLGAGIMAAHGNIPGAVAAAVLPKVLQYAPVAGRAATRAGAGANAMMGRLAEAAASGNPWAKARLAAIQGAPTAGVIGGAEGLNNLSHP